MQLLANEIGIPIEVKYLGLWSRVQELARGGRIDLIAGAFFTSARTDYLIYEEDPGLAFAAKLNITGLKTATTPANTENLFLTLAHKSPCNTGELRGRIARAYCEGHADLGQ